MSGQGIIFLTHIESKRIFDHFERLREETRGLMSAVLCIHDLGLSGGRGILKKIRGTSKIPAPHVRIDVESGARLLPNRFAQMQRLGRWYNTGFPDLAYMPALLSDQMREYDYIWFVENDVDYAGNWRDFFLSTMDRKEDFLSTYIYSRMANSEWEHWSWFRAPSEVAFDLQTTSFNPIMRLSRRMLSTYVKTVQNASWQGHTEALIPTIARYNGFSICDLGGWGDFCPEAWRDKHYRNPVVEGWDHRKPGRGWRDRSKGQLGPLADKPTFIFTPAVQSAYFHEGPRAYLERNLLYHPVKVYRHRTLRSRLQALKARVVDFRPRKAAWARPSFAR